MTAVTGSVSRGAVIQTATPHGKNNEGLGLTFTVMFKFGGNDPQVLSSCNSENGSSLESSGTFSGELERVTGSTPPNTHTNGKGQTTGLNGKNQSNSSANENNQAVLVPMNVMKRQRQMLPQQSRAQMFF